MELHRGKSDDNLFWRTSDGEVDPIPEMVLESPEKLANDLGKRLDNGTPVSRLRDIAGGMIASYEDCDLSDVDSLILKKLEALAKAFHRGFVLEVRLEDQGIDGEYWEGLLDDATDAHFVAGIIFSDIIRKIAESDHKTQDQFTEILKKLSDRGNDTKRKLVAQRKQSAIDELNRRHKNNPKASKNSHLTAMAEDPENDWGSLRTLGKYCSDVEF